MNTHAYAVIQSADLVVKPAYDRAEYVNLHFIPLVYVHFSSFYAAIPQYRRTEGSTLGWLWNNNPSRQEAGAGCVFT